MGDCGRGKVVLACRNCKEVGHVETVSLIFRDFVLHQIKVAVFFREWQQTCVFYFVRKKTGAISFGSRRLTVSKRRLL